MMMEMFGGLFVVMLLAYSIIPLFPFVYVLLRWKQGREGEPPDPQLGLKVALHYFATLGLHVLLMAAVAGLYSFLIDGDRAAETLLRTAAGLALGGGVVYGVHRALLGRLTDTATRPNVARMFAGLNLVLCGLVGMGALLTITVLLLQEDTPEDPFKLAIVLMVVYLAGWAASAMKLARFVAAKPA